MRRMTWMAIGVLAVAFTGRLSAGEPKVEEQLIGPASTEATYVVSPKGDHLAIVTRKGSRMAVIYDGESGPKFESIITPVAAWVDPRPYSGPSAVAMPPKPVTFSRDGSRHAYVGKLGDEWVLMVDGKEAMRIPAAGAVGGVAGVAGNAGNTDVRMEFTGASGKHLLFARSVFNGYELWVDGQKWPGVYQSGGGGSAGTVDPLVSPDGSRIAYMAQLSRDKSSMIIDGQDAGYTADNLQWSPDGKHLIGIFHDKASMHLMIDAKSVVNARGIYNVYLPPVGGRIIMSMLHLDPKTSAQSQFLWADGKPVETSGCQSVKKVVFSPDGKRYAAICTKQGGEFVLVDGKKGQDYQFIIDGGAFKFGELAFSPDSTKVTYVGNASGKQFLVTGDDESDAFDSTPSFMYVDGGKHLVTVGLRNQGAILGIDNKIMKRPFNSAPVIDSFVCTPGMTHYAILVGVNPNTGGQVLLDGKETGLAGAFAMNADGSHIAVNGYRPTDNAAGLFVDDLAVYAMQQAILYHAFSPDGKHLYWMAVEPSKAAGAAPGSYELVTYLDGKAVVHCERRPEAERILLPNGYGRFPRTTPAWDIQPDGSMVCMTVAGESVNRVKITPAADWNVETWLAEVRKDAAGKAGGKRK